MGIQAPRPFRLAFGKPPLLGKGRREVFSASHLPLERRDREKKIFLRKPSPFEAMERFFLEGARDRGWRSVYGCKRRSHEDGPTRAQLRGITA